MLSTGQAVRLSSLLVGLAALTALICGTRRAGGARWAFTQGVALAAVAVSAVLRVLGYGRPAPGWGRWPDALLASAVVVVGLGALEEIRRTRSVRRQVARFADELSTLPGQRDADNRPAVHEVQFADFDGEWVTADGAAAALDADLPHLELIDRHGRPTVRLVPRAGMPADRLGRSVTPAARLALENARLAALARRRMTEVEESDTGSSRPRPSSCAGSGATCMTGRSNALWACCSTCGRPRRLETTGRSATSWTQPRRR